MSSEFNSIKFIEPKQIKVLQSFDSNSNLNETIVIETNPTNSIKGILLDTSWEKYGEVINSQILIEGMDPDKKYCLIPLYNYKFTPTKDNSITRMMAAVKQDETLSLDDLNKMQVYIDECNQNENGRAGK